jgi:hypothetical protein
MIREIKQLPNSIREFLLKSHEDCVRLWDLMLTLDLPDLFTASELLNHCELTRYQIYQGLKDLKRLKVLAIKTVRNGLRGRPVQCFRLTPVRLIIERWGLRSGESDPLDREAMQSPKKYRAALHRAFIKRVRPEWSRKQLGRRLGVSGRATFNYEQLYSDIVVTPQFAELEVKLPKDFEYDVLHSMSSADIPYELAGGAKWLEAWIPVAYSEAEILQYNLWVGAEKIVKKKYPYLRFLAEKLLRAGLRVFAVEQRANKYSVKSEYDDWMDS